MRNKIFAFGEAANTTLNIGRRFAGDVVPKEWTGFKNELISANVRDRWIMEKFAIVERDN